MSQYDEQISKAYDQYLDVWDSFCFESWGKTSSDDVDAAMDRLMDLFPTGSELLSDEEHGFAPYVLQPTGNIYYITQLDRY